MRDKEIVVDATAVEERLIERKWDWWGKDRDGEIDSKEDGHMEQREGREICGRDIAYS